MPIDASNIELRRNPEQDVQEILSGVTALYGPEQPKRVEAIDTIPSLFDSSEPPEVEQPVIDFDKMAEQITDNPRQHIAHIVAIGEGITRIREHFADAV